ncbi:hypothetical protein [Butyrivibrio sp. YAB3001]|uniref:hypothetical protein n=1 Tax=Butyrivibrio sp. YAB3001 TaxID=1520812 RepID=UPI0008F68910|nr:hypothetical protein [Butyrivibrio sp. YAB3001]SFC42352.1 hypothetical protein SAMN02910398_02227 [Butyrivibrio sp. YAB3001]
MKLRTDLDVHMLKSMQEVLEYGFEEKLNKTCTIMDSRGAIAGENNTLICYISYFELPLMKEIISVHSGSFSTVSTIDEILR